MSLQSKTLFIAMELSNKKWKLAVGDGSQVRIRTLPARAQEAFLREVSNAKLKFGLDADCRVCCCYEAGRDGFWIDRFLQAHGFENIVIDPASIEVSRRGRRRKNDRLDAEMLLDRLLRAQLWGDAKAFAPVRVPSEEQEDQMRLYRERERLSKERTGHRARIKSLLVLHGIDASNPARVNVEELTIWSGRPLAPRIAAEILREQQRLRLVEEQIAELEKEQMQVLEDPQSNVERMICKLASLKSVGPQSSWVLVHECFAWREFKNRKHLGSFAGLTGTPYDSGDSSREQGISKVGSARVRTAMIELAWGWLRWQPGSELSRWYQHRFGSGTRRSRRVGIVALARKLLIAMWKYLQNDELPTGALLKV